MAAVPQCLDLSCATCRCFASRRSSAGAGKMRCQRPDESGLQSRQRQAASARSRTWAPPKRGARSKRPTRRLPDWRARTAKERAQILRKWFDLMMANQEDLAVLMTVEQGKPLLESRGEIAYAASFIEWFAEEGKRAYGDVIPAPRPRQAHRGAEAADRRHRGDHAVEFPGRDDHPQGRAGARRGLHDGDQARGADAVFRARDVRAGRARRHSGGRRFRGHRRLQADRR